MNIAQFRKLVDEHVSRIAGVALDDLPDVALDDYLDSDDSIEDGVAAETALEAAIEILEEEGIDETVLRQARLSPAVDRVVSVLAFWATLSSRAQAAAGELLRGSRDVAAEKAGGVDSADFELAEDLVGRIVNREIPAACLAIYWAHGGPAADD